MIPLTHEEQVIGDALRTLGLLFYSPHEGPRDEVCVVCGKDKTDFTAFSTVGMLGRSFHVECLPAMRRPKMSMPFAFEYLRKIEIDRMVEEAAKGEAQKREALLRRLLFDVRDAINRLMKAIE